jgi:hypothetical protein
LRRHSGRNGHPSLPTPRSTLRAGYLDVLVWRKACHRQAPADLQAIIDSGRGDLEVSEHTCRLSNVPTDYGGPKRRAKMSLIFALLLIGLPFAFMVYDVFTGGEAVTRLGRRGT